MGEVCNLSPAATKLLEETVGQEGIDQISALDFSQYTALPNVSFHAGAEPVEGDRLSNYLLMRLVGRGAYGEVWLANDLRANELVALKKLKLTDLREGFPNLALREISLLMELSSHPNIVKLHSVVFSLPHYEAPEGDNVPLPLDALKNLREDILAKAHYPAAKARKLSDGTLALLRPTGEQASLLDGGSPGAPSGSGDTEEFLLSSSGSIWMVFEFTPFDLHTYIELNEHDGKLLTIPEVKLIVQELLMALELCHSNNILHRDLKTANLLIDFAGHIKLADFGLARPFSSMSTFVYPDDIDLEPDSTLMDLHLTNRVVTLWYRPPEILLGSREYTTSADIWSVGCIVYEMICGKALFRAENEWGVLRCIMAKIGPPSEASWPEYSNMPLRHSPTANPLINEPALAVPKENQAKTKVVSLAGEGAWEFISSMLKYNPAQRMTASEALSHPWLKRGVAECLHIDAEKAALGNSVTLKRERERVRGATSRQTQRRTQNRARYLFVDEQLERLRTSRLHQSQYLVDHLEKAVNEKEIELQRWQAILKQIPPQEGLASNQGSRKDTTTTRVSRPSEDYTLEEGEIASPINDEAGGNNRASTILIEESKPPSRPATDQPPTPPAKEGLAMF